MSHSSYTASERRGMIAIAVIALLLVGGGVGLTLCERSRNYDEFPIVTEHPEMIDSSSLINKKEDADSSRKPNKNKKKQNKNNSKNKIQDKKTYRKRSPLDEPV